jgi:hypothetical protein
VATDTEWHARSYASKWIGNGRAGLVLQTEIVGDKQGLQDAKKNLQLAQFHLNAELRLQQAARDNQEMLSEQNSEKTGTGRTEAEDAKAIQHLEHLEAEASKEYERMKIATVVQPMRECKKGRANGKTVVKGGQVKNIGRQLSMGEQTRADVSKSLAVSKSLSQSIFRVGPPGPLNPSFSAEIIHRLTNQVRHAPVLSLFAIASEISPQDKISVSSLIQIVPEAQALVARHSNSVVVCMIAV